MDNLKKIAKVISNDSCISLNEIAEKTGLSRHTVGRYLHKMKKEKIIWGTYTIIDDSIFKDKTYVLMVKSKSNIDKNKQFIRYFNEDWKKLDLNIPVIFSGILHGEYDLVVIFKAKDIIDARNFFSRLFSNYLEMIEKYIILENLVTIRRCGHINPNLDGFLEMLQNVQKK